VIDPDKVPDIRPDKRKFWLLRGLSWLLFLGGLAALAFGCVHGALAYYGTKNGAEFQRILGSTAYVLVSVTVGLMMMGVGQVFRVIMAIEENTRLIAYHTRPRQRPPEEIRQRTVPSQPAERMRV